MEPQHLPQGWRVEHRIARTFGVHSKFGKEDDEDDDQWLKLISFKCLRPISQNRLLLDFLELINFILKSCRWPWINVANSTNLFQICVELGLKLLFKQRLHLDIELKSSAEVFGQVFQAISIIDPNSALLFRSDINVNVHYKVSFLAFIF